MPWSTGKTASSVSPQQHHSTLDVLRQDRLWLFTAQFWQPLVQMHEDSCMMHLHKRQFFLTTFQDPGLSSCIEKKFWSYIQSNQALWILPTATPVHVHIRLVMRCSSDYIISVLRFSVYCPFSSFIVEALLWLPPSIHALSIRLCSLVFVHSETFSEHG